MQPKTKQDTRKDDKNNRRFWQAHMKVLLTSGYSRAEYCRLNKLSYHALAYWQKRIGTEVEPKMTSVIVPVAQIPARQISLQATTHPSFTVDLKGRFKIEVGENFSPSMLIRLINTLEAC
ncbi:MAG: hypothetical protein P4L42_12595 [Desulfocapsaceae bacterium]|nr:hypothetical protein [Desulfocapsaceae bacterium]